MRFLTFAVVAVFAATSAAAERPNIVWISCEDISSHLSCYGDPNATTPNLDALAQQGVRFTQAFTCHGVCAPSRTGIITGMYPIGLGANHMRSKATLPEHIKCFPYYLKQAGYYCTNNSKTDYNFHWNQDEVWDESSRKAHWKNRPNSDQPFFAVFNLTMTHESRIWPKNWQNVVKGLPKDKLHDPNKIRVPELYPDVQSVRQAHARLLDIITVMDQEVGKYLKELDDAGLSDSTIVIFWSDHGNGFPRAKRWIYDSGTLVPMIARVPEALRVDGQAEPGSANDQLINLIDLGPTTLNLAGIDIPEHMFGQPFLGPGLPEPRQYIYGARDRVDERFDMVRSVRNRRYRYIRNYNAWRPALQHIKYAETSVVRQEMRRLDDAGTLARESSQFLHAPRAPEELYDLQVDPWEVRNLAADPQLAETLNSLRQACDQWQLKVRDVHLIPESVLHGEEKDVGSRWGILHGSDSGQIRTSRLMDIARLATAPGPQAKDRLLQAAESQDAAERWWALHGLANLRASDSAALQVIRNATKDNSPGVRVAAARALYHAGKPSEAYDLLKAAVGGSNEFVRHAALNEIDELGTAPSDVLEAVRPLRGKREYSGNLATHILQQAEGTK